MKISVEIEVPDPLLEPVFRALATEASRLTLADAARLVHLSPSRFSSVFRHLGGMSFRAARLEAKLGMAEALLGGTSLRVSEIAQRLGYARLSRFERAFKRKHGLSPLEYRRGRGRCPAGWLGSHANAVVEELRNDRSGA